MKIKKLVIENFMAIHQAEIDLDDKGLILIQGENRDEPSAESNGAGKSSIVDALSWVIYGITARGESGDDVINNKVGKDCRVVATIEDDGAIYVVARHRKHKDGKNRLYLFRDGADITKGTDKLTQVDITKIVGCSAEVFNSSIYAAQEAMPDLPGMTDRFLKQLVEEAAGVDRLEEAYKIASKKANGQKAVVSDIEVRLSSEERMKAETKVRCLDLQAKSKDWADQREIRLMDAEQKIVEATLKSRELAKELMAKNRAGLTAELEAVQARISSVSGEQEKLRQITAKESTLQANIKHQELRVADKAEVVRKLAGQIKNLSSQIGSPCGECGKPYAEHDLDEVKLRLHGRLEVAKTEFHDEKAKHAEFVEALQKLSAAKQSFIESMTDLSAEIAAEADLKREYDELQRSKMQVEKSREAIQQAKQAKEAVEAEQNPYHALIKVEEEAVLHKEAAIAALNTTLSEERKRLINMSLAVKVFSPAGVRSHILDAVTPFLNERTAHYLGVLSDGSITAEWSTVDTTKKGEVKDKFNINVINSKGAHSFKGLSGGEKRKVRLSTAMALQDLVAARATKPIDLFIGDEIDDALDSAGLERLMTLLEAKAREKGTVLVVSHKEMKSWFRQFITVIKEGGGSRIEANF